MNQNICEGEMKELRGVWISFKLLRNVREAELVEDDFVFKWGRNDNCIIWVTI